MKKNVWKRTEESHAIISDEIRDTIVNILTIIYMMRDKNI